MRASIICSSSTYEKRADMVRNWFEQHGFDTQMVVPDWDHLLKGKRSVAGDKQVVAVRPYSKNISISRVLSCRDFSKGAVQAVRQFAPDVVYATIPPNTLARNLAEYRRRNSGAKLVLDIVDLWPEAFPRSGVSGTPLYRVWKKLRDASLRDADLVLVECEMFSEKLADALGDTQCAVVRYAREDSGIEPKASLADDEYRLCYLGGINNIIDIGEIVRVVSALPRRAIVEVVGDGESRDAFLGALVAAGVAYVFHGRVFDEVEKHEIMSRCHFGLNFMKSNVAVGLSMKSVDYLEAGLPILNNLGGDTERMIRERCVGINVLNGEHPSKEALNAVCLHREEARRTYEELFSEGAFNSSLNGALLDTGSREAIAG